MTPIMYSLHSTINFIERGKAHRKSQIYIIPIFLVWLELLMITECRILEMYTQHPICGIIWKALKSYSRSYWTESPFFFFCLFLCNHLNMIPGIILYVWGMNWCSWCHQFSKRHFTSVRFICTRFIICKWHQLLIRNIEDLVFLG